MSRSSSSSFAASSSRCVQCDRLRDELALLKLQRPAATATAAASSPSAATSSPSAASAPPPPLLYQLQRGVAPRQPSASPTRIVAAAIAAPAPKSKSSSAAAVPKKQAPVKLPAAASALPASSPRVVTSVASSTQTSLDLDPACLASVESVCLRCPCCAILQARLSELTTARDAAESSLQQSQAAVKTHEANVAGWQRSLKSMREQLAAAQSQMAQQHSKPPSALQSELHAARKQLAEQDRQIRSLQEQREADQRWIARMQEQLSGGAPPSAASASASSVAAVSSADGLSSVQREQLKLRMGAERALLKLQQLFPDQQIGGSRGAPNGGLSSGSVSSSIGSAATRQ